MTSKLEKKNDPADQRGKSIAISELNCPTNCNSPEGSIVFHVVVMNCHR